MYKQEKTAMILRLNVGIGSEFANPGTDKKCYLTVQLFKMSTPPKHV